MALLAVQPDIGDDDPNGVKEYVRQIVISGAAITIPLVVTAVVLVVIVNFVLGFVGPPVNMIAEALGVGQDLEQWVLQLVAAVTLLVTIFAVGIVAELRSGSGIEQAFDTAIARIPGIGSVYTSFNEMSKMLLTDDTRSFREVKLVEYPTSGSYTVGFVTADTPEEVRSATDHEEMTTLFMPMAPNPVMGGFVMHVADDRIHDVDMTVEEGVRSIVTSGVATGEADAARHDGELVDLERLREQARDGMAGVESFGARTASDIREMTVEEFASLKSMTGDVDIRREEEDDEGRVHYMIERSAEDDEWTDTATVTGDDGTTANDRDARRGTDADGENSDG